MESQPLFGGESFISLFNTLKAWLFAEVFTAANVVYTAMQIPALVGSGFAAWWVHDFVTPVLEERIKRSNLTDYGKDILLVLVSLLFPFFWAIGLGVSVAVSGYFGWPHNLIWIAINLLGAWVVIRIFSILVRDPIWSRMIAFTAYTVAVLNVFDLLGPTAVVLDQLAVSVGKLRISMLTVIKGMFSLGLLLWIALLASRILERRVQRLPNLTPSVQVLIGKLFKASLITIAIVVSLSSIGIDLTALAVFSGAVGVGIGFGLQKVVSNLISGIILLMDKSIKPGDIILIGDTYGWVDSLGARYVAVETRDGTNYLIPNEDIITQQVVNWSHTKLLARLKVKVRLPYEADVDKALELMKEAAGKCPRVLKQPAPNPLLIEFGESCFELELRFWIRDVRNGIRNISSQVMLEIWKLFRENGITVPVPKRDIFLRNPSPVYAKADSMDEEEPPMVRVSGLSKVSSAPQQSAD